MSKRTRKLRRLNRHLDEKLTPASTAMLHQITRRICTAPISAYHQESIRHDVIEILQEAESRGASPEEAIGSDIAAFCDSVLAALGEDTGAPGTELIGRLAERTGVPAPKTLATLAGRAVRFDGCIDRSDMERLVGDFLR